MANWLWVVIFRLCSALVTVFTTPLQTLSLQGKHQYLNVQNNSFLLFYFYFIEYNKETATSVYHHDLWKWKKKNNLQAP